MPVVRSLVLSSPISYHEENIMKSITSKAYKSPGLLHLFKGTHCSWQKNDYTFLLSDQELVHFVATLSLKP